MPTAPMITTIHFAAEDPHAPATLNFYADRLEAAGGPPDRVREIRLLANRMREWLMTPAPAEAIADEPKLP